MEIVRYQEPTHVPEAPPAVDGIINLRGTVIPVIDLRKLLGLRIQPISRDSRIVVVDIRGESMGVIVDAVAEVLRLSNDRVEQAPTVSGSMDSANIDGVVNENNRLMILLNLERALSPDSFQNANVRAEHARQGAAVTEAEPESVAEAQPGAVTLPAAGPEAGPALAAS